jgi:hypothetical protein
MALVAKPCHLLCSFITDQRNDALSAAGPV